MSFRTDRQRKRVMGYEIGHRSYPHNDMSHNERSTRVFGPNDGKIITGRAENGESLILDNVVYDPLPADHVDVDTAKKERDILVSRGDEAIVRQNKKGTYRVWVRSR
jgi:hypothetical protein